MAKQHRGIQRRGTLADRGEPPINGEVRQERSMSTFRAQFHMGPLPAPDDLVRYNDAFDGCAERIVAMAERQSQHRQELESATNKANNRRETQGQWMAFVVSLFVIGGGILLIHNDKPTTGFVAILLPVATLAATFIAKRSSERKQIQARRRDLEAKTD